MQRIFHLPKNPCTVNSLLPHGAGTLLAESIYCPVSIDVESVSGIFTLPD